MDEQSGKADDAVVNNAKAHGTASNGNGNGSGSGNGLAPPPINTYRQVTILSVSFCLIFTAYASAQNYATSRDKHIGSVSLGILYATFTFTNIVASAILMRIGAKTCLILGSLTYGGFVAASITFKAPIMYPMSAVIGAGAAILWTAQGAYVTRCSQYYEHHSGELPGSSVGSFNGLFWSIFQISQFGGNLLVAMLFHFDVSDQTVFVVMTCVCFTGSAGLFAIRQMEPKAYTLLPVGGAGHSDSLLAGVAGGDGDGGADDNNGKPKDITCYSLVAPLGLLLNRRMQLIVPLIVYSGVSQGFIFGDFPPLISDKQWKFFVMAAFGAADVASSILLGKPSDKIGRKAVVAIGLIVHMTGFLFLFFYQIGGEQYGLFFFVAIVFGIGDGVFNTQIYAIVGVLFDGNAESAFACFKFLQAGSTASAFLYDDAWGNTTKLYICMALLLVAVPLVYLLDWAVAPIDAAKKKAANSN